MTKTLFCEGLQVSQQFAVVIRDDTVISYTLCSAVVLGRVGGRAEDGREFVQVEGIDLRQSVRVEKNSGGFGQDSRLIVQISQVYVSVEERLLKVYHTYYLFAKLGSLYSVAWVEPYLRRYRAEEGADSSRVDLTTLLLAVEGHLQGTSQLIR